MSEKGEGVDPTGQQPDFATRVTERLKRLRAITHIDPTEFKDDLPADPRTILQERWAETESDLTSEQLQALILSKEFGDKVVEAISKTVGDNLLSKGSAKHFDPLEMKKLGREYGMVLFHHPGDERELQLSPVFEGDEESINLGLQSEKYRKEIDHDGKRALVLHTHPDVISSLFGEIFRGDSSSEFNPDSNLVDGFSEADLKNFKKIAGNENMSLIYALGVQSPRPKTGKFVLVSFNNFDQFMSFRPDAVVAEWRKDKQSQPDITPLDVFRRNGLNATALSVNLKAGQSFKPAEVREAARILTTRVT